MIAITVFLAFAAALGAGGYVRAAFDDFGGREQMPMLLLTVTLALGFLGLILK